MLCPGCQASNEEGANECFNCGMPFLKKEEKGMEKMEAVQLSEEKVNELFLASVSNGKATYEEFLPEEEGKSLKTSGEVYTQKEIQDQQKAVEKEVRLLNDNEKIIDKLISELDRNAEFAAGGSSKAYKVKNEFAIDWLDAFIFGDEELARKNGLDISQLPKDLEDQLIVLQEVKRRVIPAAQRFVDDRIKFITAKIMLYFPEQWDVSEVAGR